MNSCNLCNDGVTAAPSYNSASACTNPPTQLTTVKIPASKGGDGPNDPNAPTLGAWRNTIVQYEKGNAVYIYDVNGVYTNLTGTDYASQIVDLTNEVQSLTDSINSLQTALETETTNRQNSGTNLQEQIDTLTQQLNTANTSLNQAVQDAQNVANAAQATANDAAAGLATEITNRINGDNDLQTAITDEATARGEADTDLQSQITENSNAIAALQANGGGGGGDASYLNKTVQYDTTLTGDLSTLTLTKTTGVLGNIETTETNIAFPVASAEQAGVMNASTYQAVQNNAEDVDAIKNGAVAIENVPANPTQTELTDLWKNATNRTELVNRASIFDVDNEKLWYYYTNDSTWHAAGGNTGDVTVSVATNDTAGIVQGSTTDGQIAVEANGQMSLNGYDALVTADSNLNSLVASAQNDATSALDKWGTLPLWVVGSATDSIGPIEPRFIGSPTAVNMYFRAVNTSTGQVMDSSKALPAASGTQHGTMSPTHYTKINGLANIKSVGNGLSLSNEGVLTATGGGSSDSRFHAIWPTGSEPDDEDTIAANTLSAAGVLKDVGGRIPNAGYYQVIMSLNATLTTNTGANVAFPVQACFTHNNGGTYTTKGYGTLVFPSTTNTAQRNSGATVMFYLAASEVTYSDQTGTVFPRFCFRVFNPTSSAITLSNTSFTVSITQMS